MKAICINNDYYDDIDVQSIEDVGKNEKQNENYVFGNLSCENLELDSCICHEENSKIYFESPETTLFNIESNNSLCHRYILCADGVVEYRFVANNFEHEGDCEKNMIVLCSVDLDPEVLSLGDSGRFSN